MGGWVPYGVALGLGDVAEDGFDGLEGLVVLALPGGDGEGDEEPLRLLQDGRAAPRPRLLPVQVLQPPAHAPQALQTKAHSLHMGWQSRGGEP